MLKQPSTVTILVALYKAGGYLEAKLQDLQQQTHFQYCNIVLLNCQNLDDEASIYAEFVASNPNVTAIEYPEHVRLYPTWNDGIKATASNYIMNSNVDDMLHPEYVESCSNWLDTHPQFAVVSTRILLTYKSNQVWPHWEWHGDLPFRAFPASTPGPCPMWRRELHGKYGYFSDLRVIGDADMWERFKIGDEKFGLLDRNLVLYYAHHDSLERRVDDKGREFKTLDLVEREQWRKDKK